MFFSLLLLSDVTAPLIHIPTLIFKPQPGNSFFATVNQMFGGSPPWGTVEAAKQCSAVVGGAAEHLIDGGQSDVRQ